METGMPENIAKRWYRANQLLDRRYEKCDTNGHQKLGEHGYCSYCYRHLSYSIDKEARINPEPDKHSMPVAKKNLAPELLKKVEEEEIKVLRDIDRFLGVIKILTKID
jgi:hypothetical protein